MRKTEYEFQVIYPMLPSIFEYKLEKLGATPSHSLYSALQLLASWKFSTAHRGAKKCDLKHQNNSSHLDAAGHTIKVCPDTSVYNHHALYIICRLHLNRWGCSTFCI